MYVEIRTLGVEVVKFVAFLTEGLGYFLRPFLILCLLEQFLFLRRTFTIADLGLQILDLLLEEVVALLFVDVLTGLVTDICFQMLEVNLTVDNLHHLEETFFDGLCL